MLKAFDNFAERFEEWLFDEKVFRRIMVAFLLLWLIVGVITFLYFLVAVCYIFTMWLLLLLLKVLGSFI